MAVQRPLGGEETLGTVSQPGGNCHGGSPNQFWTYGPVVATKSIAQGANFIERLLREQPLGPSAWGLSAIDEYGFAFKLNKGFGHSLYRSLNGKDRHFVLNERSLIMPVCK